MNPQGAQGPLGSPSPTLVMNTTIGLTMLGRLKAAVKSQRVMGTAPPSSTGEHFLFDLAAADAQPKRAERIRAETRLPVQRFGRMVSLGRK
jgi:hypothetical protein